MIEKKKKITIGASIAGIVLLLVILIVVISNNKKTEENVETLENVDLSELINVENIENLSYKTEETKELSEDARIELSQGIEVVTSYSKMLKSIKETFESVINMDSNTYINRLTMWNIILVVPTVVVGYYGMNMKLPFADNEETATTIFVVIMIFLLAFAMFSLLRRRIS